MSRGRSPDPKLDPQVIPSDIDIAWAAGIYEGEGTCGSIRPTTLRVAIIQNDRWILEKFKLLFGGNICRHAEGSFHWQTYGARALNFLIVIYPYLSPRRKEQIHQLPVWQNQ